VKQATKDKKRLSKLKEILATLESGENVQNRMLKSWLTTDGYVGFESDWNEQVEWREFYKNKPYEIKQYELYLKKALFAYNKKAYAFADGQFETALEYLQEITNDGRDADMLLWFDRNTEWTIDGDVGADPDSMPRVVTSRSLENRGGLMPLYSKNKVKCICVERAIDALENPIPKTSEEVKKEKLKQLLSNIKTSVKKTSTFALA
jgi:hypothetical protein